MLLKPLEPVREKAGNMPWWYMHVAATSTWDSISHRGTNIHDDVQISSITFPAQWSDGVQHQNQGVYA